MNKVNAYTVMEMIIVMLISSVIVTMSYSIYTKVFMLNKKVGDIYKQNYNMVLFNRLVTGDVLKSESITAEDEGFSLRYKDQVVNYTLNEILIRKQAAITDSLTSLTGCEIQYSYVDSSHHIIKEIIISGLYNGDTISMVFNKQYGSDFLMKLDE